jgi:Zn-dependent protease
VPSNAAVFRLFGFPVHVRAGFFMFMVLVVMVQGPTFGIPFAVFLALFTLLHELGHAFAARATGAEAQIALDFMAGYAAFTPTRPLKRWERVGISFAGPGVQILVGTVVYVMLRGQLAMPEYGNAIQHAVFWSGPIIGLFNLVPVLPFDGGTIAEVGVELVARDRAHQIMQWFTIAVAIVAMVWMALDPNLVRFIFFAVIPLLSVLASMNQERNHLRRAKGQQVLARAEALAWATGQVQFPTGTVPSPWFRAWQQLQFGDRNAALHVLLLDLADTEPINWWPPDAAPVEALRQVADVLPQPMPQGRAYSATRTPLTMRPPRSVPTERRCWPCMSHAPLRRWATAPLRWRGCAPPRRRRPTWSRTPLITPRSSTPCATTPSSLPRSAVEDLRRELLRGDQAVGGM